MIFAEMESRSNTTRITLVHYLAMGPYLITWKMMKMLAGRQGGAASRKHSQAA